MTFSSTSGGQLPTKYHISEVELVEKLVHEHRVLKKGLMSIAENSVLPPQLRETPAPLHEQLEALDRMVRTCTGGIPTRIMRIAQQVPELKILVLLWNALATRRVHENASPKIS